MYTRGTIRSIRYRQVLIKKKQPIVNEPNLLKIWFFTCVLYVCGMAGKCIRIFKYVLSYYFKSII